MAHLSRTSLALIWLALAASLCVGILGRGYWTPDEPREADLAWRMSWQDAKAVPLLAGEPFCEKPPLTYWLAAVTIGAFGIDAWAARLPNLLYALITALAVGAIARRSAGPIAGVAAAAAVSSFLLSYQVAIWLATDAPLVAAVAAALLGLHVGFYAADGRERLRGYTCMHLALAVGFLAKSAAAWMVPVLTFAALGIWERRWRELLRWELYGGLLLQVALIGSWVWVVHDGPDGPAHLKVFFWNNLVGRFAAVDAPPDLQYAAGHRNSPGKYLIELPLYLCPWTLLVAAAVRRAWRERHRPRPAHLRTARFAAATVIPTLGVLSVAATARNIYLAPALPGAALLLGWWVRELPAAADAWDARALGATALLMLLATGVFAGCAALIGADSAILMRSPLGFVAIAGLGLAGAAAASIYAWRSVARRRLQAAAFALLLGYSALLVGPASQIYRGVDAWQDLQSIGTRIARDAVGDAVGRPLILMAPDETTRAMIDLYARTTVDLIPGPITARSVDRLEHELAAFPGALVVTQLPGRDASATLRKAAALLGLSARLSAPAGDAVPAWAAALTLCFAHRYALPNGRRYALLARDCAAAPTTASR